MQWSHAARLKAMVMRSAAGFLGGEDTEAVMSMFQHPSQGIQMLSACGVDWARYGFPSISLGARHAASLMATRVPLHHAEELRVPWNVWWLNIPTGLLTMPSQQTGRDLELNGLLVAAAPTGDFRVMICSPETLACICTSSPARMASADAGDLSYQSEEVDIHTTHDYTCSIRFRRIAGLAGRLIVGVMIELGVQHPALQQVSPTNSPPRTPRGEPKCTNFVLTRDVKIDCRQSIIEFVAGRSSNRPTVQVLVRGHWKRQSCGPRASERRWTFIEPYWRGPEDAPIAVREHVLVPEVAS
jgi:hypothetical protein